MAIGRARFMHTNLITEAGLSASSQAAGTASRPQKEGSGSGGMLVGGTYTGTEDLDYYVEIESTGEIGVATFAWSDDGGASFDGTGVTTSTSPVTLNNGLTVRWTQGAGNDVVDGDVWRFKAFLPYHRRKLLDRDRDSEWRSDGVGSVVYLTGDLLSALTPKVVILFDHNLTAAAQVRVQASTVSNFSSLGVNDAIVWTTQHLVHFIGDPDRTYRYWRVLLSDPANPDGYLRASELFLGRYDQFTRTFDLGDTRGKLRVGQRDRSLSGRYFGALNTVVRAFDLSWSRLSETDRDVLVAVFDALNDLTTREVRPLFFTPTHETPAATYLCEWQDGTIAPYAEQEQPGRYTVPVRLVEIPRTVATLAAY